MREIHEIWRIFQIRQTSSATTTTTFESRTQSDHKVVSENGAQPRNLFLSRKYLTSTCDSIDHIYEKLRVVIISRTSSRAEKLYVFSWQGKRDAMMRTMRRFVVLSEKSTSTSPKAFSTVYREYDSQSYARCDQSYQASSLDLSILERTVVKNPLDNTSKTRFLYDALRWGISFASIARASERERKRRFPRSQ